MFSLSSSSTYIFAPMAIFMALNFLFLNGAWGMKQTGCAANIYYSNPEFFFTRAISRRAQFYAKSLVYFLLSSLLSLVILGYSFTKPAIKVELPYNTLQFREQVKQFYLTQFTGTTLTGELNDPEKGKIYVVLPHGHIWLAAFGVVQMFVSALLLQSLVFWLGRKPWILLAVFFGLLLFPLLDGVIMAAFTGTSSPFQQISLYERSLAWTAHHPTVVLFLLAALTVAVQAYCCSRFIKAEVVQ